MLGTLITPLAWLRLGLLGAVLALGAWAWHSHGASERKRGQAEVQAEWDADMKARHGAALLAIEENRVEKARRDEVQKESLHVAKLAQAHHDANLVAAARSSERLLLASAAQPTCGGAAAEGTTPGQGSQATTPAVDLRTIVLGRLDEAAGRVGDYADRLDIALTKCNADYEALVLQPRTP